MSEILRKIGPFKSLCWNIDVTVELSVRECVTFELIRYWHGNNLLECLLEAAKFYAINEEA